MGKFAWSHLREYLSHCAVKPWQKDAWNLQSWSSSSRALSWHEGHLYSLGGNSAFLCCRAGQETTSSSQWQRLGLADKSGYVSSLLLQHIASAVGAVPAASRQWMPTLLLHPLSVWAVSCSHLIALRAKGCKALKFKASCRLGVALRQSFVIFTCFSLGLPNHRQCLLALGSLEYNSLPHRL